MKDENTSLLPRKERVLNSYQQPRRIAFARGLYPEAFCFHTSYFILHTSDNAKSSGLPNAGG
jgi:hypothetical protein